MVCLKRLVKPQPWMISAMPRNSPMFYEETSSCIFDTRSTHFQAKDSAKNIAKPFLEECQSGCWELFMRNIF